MGVDLQLYALDPGLNRLLLFEVERRSYYWDYFRDLDQIPAPENAGSLPVYECYKGSPRKGPGSKRCIQPVSTAFRRVGRSVPEEDNYGHTVVWVKAEDIRIILEVTECTNLIDAYDAFCNLIPDSSPVALYWH